MYGIDVKNVARTLIEEHAQNVPMEHIREMLGDDADSRGLSGSQRDSVCRRVDCLIADAVITVDWP